MCQEESWKEGLRGKRKTKVSEDKPGGCKGQVLGLTGDKITEVN